MKIPGDIRDCNDFLKLAEKRLQECPEPLAEVCTAVCKTTHYVDWLKCGAFKCISDKDGKVIAVQHRLSGTQVRLTAAQSPLFAKGLNK